MELVRLDIIVLPEPKLLDQLALIVLRENTALQEVAQRLNVLQELIVQKISQIVALSALKDTIALLAPQIIRLPLAQLVMSALLALSLPLNTSALLESINLTQAKDLALIATLVLIVKLKDLPLLLGIVTVDTIAREVSQPKHQFLLAVKLDTIALLALPL